MCLHLERSPTTMVENGKIGNALDVVGIILDNQTCREPHLQPLNEARLVHAFTHDAS